MKLLTKWFVFIDFFSISIMIFRKLLLITSIFPFFVLARNTYFVSIKSLKINDINKFSSIKEIYDTSLYFKKNRYQFQDISHPLTQKITVL